MLPLKRRNDLTPSNRNQKNRLLSFLAKATTKYNTLSLHRGHKINDAFSKKPEAVAAL
jgi:hypothetical protein